MLTALSSAVLVGLLGVQDPRVLAPFFATPPDVVDRMLALAQVTATDVVYDLGSGDGRIPIAAAVKHGARGVGIDIVPARIEESKANALKAGVADRVEFRLEDVMTADVSGASVVTLYLLSSSNQKLRPRLMQQLKPGSRIVSHAFSMGPEWPADKVDRYTTESGDVVTLYLWIVK